MRTTLHLRYQDGNHIRWSDAVAALGSEKEAHKAYRRGINRTGDKARTKVRRTLAKQTGLKQKDLRKYGALRSKRANLQHLGYEITSSGRATSLKIYGAKQFSFGVRASPWGRKQVFKGAFIYAGRWNSGEPVASGHVFLRRTGASLPIDRMFGPSVPAEMAKGATREAFEGEALDLGKRIAHEVRVLTDGVVT